MLNIRKVQDHYSGNDVWGLEDDGILFDTFLSHEDAELAKQGIESCNHEGFMTVENVFNSSDGFLYFNLVCDFCGAETEMRFVVSDLDLARG